MVPTDQPQPGPDMTPSLTLRDLFSGPARYLAVTPWGALSALLTLVAMGAVIVGLQMGGLALATKLLGSDAIAEQIRSSALSSPVVLLSVAATQIPLMILIWLAAGRQDMRAETLQFSQPPLSWGACLAAGVIVVVAVGAFEWLLHKFAPAFDVFRDGRDFVAGLRSPWWWAVTLIAVVLAPIAEELAFRGFLLTALAKTRLGIIGGGLISNTLWSALHFNYSIWGMLTVFSVGLILTWLVWRTGSIRAPIVAHAMNNAASLVFLGVFSP